GETSSALIRLATLVLNQGREAAGVDAAGHAGVAYALTGLLRAFPWQARQGQVFVPPAEVLSQHGVEAADIRAGRDSPALRAALAEVVNRARHHLAETRRHIGAVTPQSAPAFLPIALVQPYLDALARGTGNPFERRVDLSRLRKLWVFWRQARRAGCA
ncbi:MAG: squalene/phytoene synthase family protein, partial [Proteobacteria bacterium]|nr:squalene/phytoene synthase family protein [Pseudomonadota bacterium]